MRGGEGGYLSVVLRPRQARHGRAGHLETARRRLHPAGRPRRRAPDPRGAERRRRRGRSVKQVVAETIVRNVRVLALDQTTAAEKDAKTIVASTATLEVGPVEAEALARAKAGGAVTLTLRAYTDLGRAVRPGRAVARFRRRPHQSRRPDLQHLGPPMIRRLTSASLAAMLVLTSSTAALADGPAAGTHVYRTPARVESAPRRRRRSWPRPPTRCCASTSPPRAPRASTLSRGKSAIIELPVDVRDMLVTNPAVADAVLRGPRRIYVLGMALGATDAVFFDASGRKHPRAWPSGSSRTPPPWRTPSRRRAAQRQHPGPDGARQRDPDRLGGQRQRRGHGLADRRQASSTSPTTC